MLIFYELSLKRLKTIRKGYKGLQRLQHHFSKLMVLQINKKTVFFWNFFNRVFQVKIHGLIANGYD